MPTNTKENGFETLIVEHLVQTNNYEQGISSEYNKDYAIDEGRLFRFLNATQPDKVKELRIAENEQEKEKFLHQLDKKMRSAGVIELLRNGLRYKHLKLDLFYVQPSFANEKAAALYGKAGAALCLHHEAGYR